MPDDFPPTPVLADDLARRLADLKTSEPNLRARDLAARLGISEAELVALSCGDGTVRLTGPFGDILQRLPDLGPIMALTRNEQCVHEKVGRFDKVSVEGRMGLVLDPEIDLRVFLWHWHSGFALTEATKDGPRRSLQFFDADGTAIHKVYLRPESDLAAFERLSADFRADDQSRAQAVTPRPAAAVPKADEAIDLDGFRAGWRGLTDTHDFFNLLRSFEVQREQGLRLIGREFSRPLDPAAPKHILEQAAASGLPIMIFVGSAGVIQIHTGTVARIVEMGPWLNVMDPGFNLHLRADLVASAYAVEKPTSDGTVTSVEIFDAEGGLIAMFFGKRKPGEPELQPWRDLVAGLPERA
ncbi:hemin-degrading factor [Zavarzinia compransoris]|uniref:Hemin-degrading factor n=1 Tax=Zavarzinia compransoris TaxID=1264899 RepID=A0A317EAA3_9PROT|nr:ChuX/HutX family heme-like substrate-binding protein [Zavarzinia compransoris]PWR23492.1 hemin-degrading factor [Zavarzinia compransoris]TDP45926.1 putative hemin transport protein [Zavarzinia compransoris]